MYQKTVYFVVRVLPVFALKMALVASISLPASKEVQAMEAPQAKVFVFKNTGATFNIPTPYIAIPLRFAERNVVDSLLLQAILPDLDGRTNLNAGEFQTPGVSRVLQILIQTPLAQKIELDRTGEAFERNNKAYTVQLLGEHFGLQMKKQIPPKSGRWQWQTLYRDTWDGQPQVTIACNGEGTVAVPHCIHHFVFSNMLIQLQYPEIELINWRQIQSNVVAKFESWKISS
jgi:hypothetical protein